MCGGCGHLAADVRFGGPRRRAAVAAAVAEGTGLAVRAALGVWTVASPTGRQHVCTTVEQLGAAVAREAGVSGARVVELALGAVEPGASVSSSRPGR